MHENAERTQTGTRWMDRSRLQELYREWAVVGGIVFIAKAAMLQRCATPHLLRMPRLDLYRYSLPLSTLWLFSYVKPRFSALPATTCQARTSSFHILHIFIYILYIKIYRNDLIQCVMTSPPNSWDRILKWRGYIHKYVILLCPSPLAREDDQAICVIQAFWPRWALLCAESCVAVPATLVFDLRGLQQRRGARKTQKYE